MKWIPLDEDYIAQAIDVVSKCQTRAEQNKAHYPATTSALLRFINDREHPMQKVDAWKEHLTDYIEMCSLDIEHFTFTFKDESIHRLFIGFDMVDWVRMQLSEKKMFWSSLTDMLAPTGFIIMILTLEQFIVYKTWFTKLPTTFIPVVCSNRLIFDMPDTVMYLAIIYKGTSLPKGVRTFAFGEKDTVRHRSINGFNKLACHLDPDINDYSFFWPALPDAFFNYIIGARTVTKPERQIIAVLGSFGINIHVWAASVGHYCFHFFNGAKKETELWNRVLLDCYFGYVRFFVQT